MNKKKIINDPVYGFITLEWERVFDLIEHPWFQRLRRIKQLGLTEMVYPGALHTRFHHALGAMHLMGLALQNLRLKGQEISDKEYEAAQIAILLHDIGHGPFSHALEYTILSGISHESISEILIRGLNQQYSGDLQMALEMFTGTYPRRFFHQLISGQLDVDRMDYLRRDGFYTGVSEASIGSDRIIKLLNVSGDQLVVEEKGTYSIEHFLIARRVMYWQVYLHKTTVSAENMLIRIIERAREQMMQGLQLTCPENLKFFLQQQVQAQDFVTKPEVLDQFTSLDDTDIWYGIKAWSKSEDPVLAGLCKGLLERKLYRLTQFPTEPSVHQREEMQDKIVKVLNINEKDIKYYLIEGILSNEAYVSGSENINILKKTGEVLDVASASDLHNIQAMSKIVRKHYVCSPKSVYLY